MKALTILIWLSWGAIVGRVLLAPSFGLKLSEALVLSVICAPAVGLLCWLRWVLRKRGASSDVERTRTREPIRLVQGSDRQPDEPGEWRGVVGKLF